MSPDWFMKGVLTKAGELLDRFTGRNWKPTSSLATSELIERLKKLLDSEAKDLNGNGKVVPQNITLKMQWDKFSTDSDNSIAKLEQELHIAAIDHINDRLYYTYAPVSIEIKPDYFTEGVKLLASFEKFDPSASEAELKVSMPDVKGIAITPPIDREDVSMTVSVEFNLEGNEVAKPLAFNVGDRKSIGRTRENDLAIDHPSISKMHAALVFNSRGKLVAADTGSTNGTFINGERLAYGRAFDLSSGDILKIGTVELSIKYQDLIELNSSEPPEINSELSSEDSVYSIELSEQKGAKSESLPHVVDAEKNPGEENSET